MFQKEGGGDYCDYFAVSEMVGCLFLLLGRLPVVVASAPVVCFFSSQTLHNAKLLSTKELKAPNTVRGLWVLQTRSKYPFCCTKRCFCLVWLFDAIEVLGVAYWGNRSDRGSDCTCNYQQPSQQFSHLPVLSWTPCLTWKKDNLQLTVVGGRESLL